NRGRTQLSLVRRSSALAGRTPGLPRQAARVERIAERSRSAVSACSACSALYVLTIPHAESLAPSEDEDAEDAHDEAGDVRGKRDAALSRVRHRGHRARVE